MKIMLVPFVCFFMISCGDSTKFADVELGRFLVTVADKTSTETDRSTENNGIPIATSPTDPSGDSRATVSSSTSESQSQLDTALAGAGLISGDSTSLSTGDGHRSAQSGQGMGAKSPAGSGVSAGDSSSGISDSQLATFCSAMFRGKAKFLKILDATNPSARLTANSDTVLAVRLSGNSPHFALDINGDTKLAGLCIVVTGNQPVTEISSSVTMEQIVYVARGNESKAHVAFSSATLGSALVDMRGNQHTIAFDGVGSSVCSSLDFDSKHSRSTCN
ncbi:MAG: hypothetical protein H7249_05805 [Chitinophagaceae bacterium]|nr:hypothetical protein [Oligoflexus sp.]